MIAENGMVRRVLRRILQEVGEQKMPKGVERLLPPLRRDEPFMVHLNGQAHRVEPGITVLAACERHRQEIESSCGGNATCGTCRVRILGGKRYMSKVARKERGALHAFKESDDDRLACQAQIYGPVDIEIPDDWRGL